MQSVKRHHETDAAYVLLAVALLVFLALMSGCGVPEDTEESDIGELIVHGIPGPDDGPGLVDYASPDAPDVPAFQDPDYVPSRDEVEKWVSGKYHGNGSPAAVCYSAASNGRKCVFPPYKQINLVTPNWNVDGPGGNCASQRAYLISQGAAPGEFDAMVAAYLSGLRSINGIGTGVVVKLNDASGTNMTLKIYCQSEATALGAFVQKSVGSSGPNLPSVGGVDPAQGIKYIVSGSDTSYHFISFENIWWVTVDPSQCAFPPGPVRSLQLVEKARYTGAHEGLHMMGFSHFTSGLMRPGIGCNNNNSTIPAAFGTALGIYNGNPSGGPTITDVGLGGQGIP